jgi:hypothetical protein
MEGYCKKIMDLLWDASAADELLTKAVTVVDAVAQGNFDRDIIRTKPFTKNVANQCTAMKVQ